MYIRIWDESQFLAVLDSGLYEDLIKQVECWLEEGYVVTRSRVPSDLDYAQARRAIALATIAQEGHNIWQADRSNYYDNYAKRLSAGKKVAQVRGVVSDQFEGISMMMHSLVKNFLILEYSQPLL